MDSQVLHHYKGIGEDGVEREWLGESAYSWAQVSTDPIRMTSRIRAARTDDDELFRGKRRIFWVGRHGSNITIRRQSRLRKCTWQREVRIKVLRETRESGELIKALLASAGQPTT
jgi:hypothetical protein